MSPLRHPRACVWKGGRPHRIDFLFLTSELGPQKVGLSSPEPGSEVWREARRERSVSDCPVYTFRFCLTTLSPDGQGNGSSVHRRSTASIFPSAYHTGQQTQPTSGRAPPVSLCSTQ